MRLREGPPMTKTAQLIAFTVVAVSAIAVGAHAERRV
jgi:hypothetical protein